jgi:ankyrin repeat protein
LHKAALNGHLSVVAYLVGEGAEVNAKDGDGWTALHNACSKVIAECLEVFPRD